MSSHTTMSGNRDLFYHYVGGLGSPSTGARPRASVEMVMVGSKLPQVCEGSVRSTVFPVVEVVTPGPERWPLRTDGTRVGKKVVDAQRT